MKNIQFKPKCFFYCEENMFFFLRNYKEFWHLPVRIWWCDIANKTKENSQKGKKNDFKESYSSFITSFLINKAIIIYIFFSIRNSLWIAVVWWRRQYHPMRSNRTQCIGNLFRQTVSVCMMSVPLKHQVLAFYFV